MRHSILILTLGFCCVSCYESLDAYLDAGDSLISAPTLHVSTYSSHYCRVNEASQIYCGGKNDYGQLGNRSTNIGVDLYVEGIMAKGVSVGYHHTCALLNSGRVACWGQSNYGQAGIEGDGDGDETTVVMEPMLIEGLQDIVQLAGGGYYSCALDTAGDIHCWGMANVSDIGPGYGDWNFGTGGPEPYTVPRLYDVDYIRATGHTTCAVTTSREAVCWGAPLITEDPAASGGGYEVRPLFSDVTDLCLGNGYLCYIKGDELWCGARRDDQELPLTKVSDTPFVEVSAKSANGPLCARTQDGAVYCVDDPLENAFKGLEPISDITDAVAIAAGNEFYCAILSSGETSCDYGSISP